MRSMIAKGHRYRTTKPVPVIAMTSWAAPFTGGYDRVLPAGETFTVAIDPPDSATAACCNPDNYRRLQRELIPLSDRVQFWIYAGFYLCISLREIQENCEPVS